MKILFVHLHGSFSVTQMTALDEGVSENGVFHACYATCRLEFIWARFVEILNASWSLSGHEKIPCVLSKIC
jgi:hypothetical protein